MRKLMLLAALLSTHVWAGSEFEQGLEAEKNLRLYEAREHFRAAVKESPDTPGVAEHTAWFLFLNGFHDEECVALLRLAGPKGQDSAAMERAARQVERELGLRGPSDPTEKDEQKAFQKMKVEQAASGTDAERGGSLVDAGEYKEGVVLLEKAVKESPDDLTLELKLARAYYWSGKKTEADQAYGRLLKKQPNNPALLYERAGVAASEDQLDRARILLAAAEKARPGDTRILLERARIESLGYDREATLEALDRIPAKDQDSAQVWLGRGRADHGLGQFAAAAESYEKALEKAPHLEEAAHRLAECHLRRGDIGAGDDIISSWQNRERGLDWDMREDLFGEMADPRMGASFASYSNSVQFLELDFGLFGSFRPIPEVEIRPSVVNSLFQQIGFSNIDRQGGLVEVNARPDDWVAVSGNVGLNGYTNDWLSPVGGVSTEFFPVHWLDLGVGVNYFDLIDFQPPFGVGIYDLVTTIGGVGNRVTSTQGTLQARLRPYAGWELFGRTRLASFSDANTFQDNLVQAAYTFRNQQPRITASYNYYYMALINPARNYQPNAGGITTPSYYDPDALNINSWKLEVVGRPVEWVEMGGEGYLYNIMENGGFGQSVFIFTKFELDGPENTLRLDGRYFTQNRGLTRNDAPGGSFNALNFLLTYEHRF
jgi:tetratricopeptide (TPR) repeat protein